MESSRKYKVLVAEDDPFQKLSLIDILTMSNYEVTTVENGEQALEQLRDPKSQFDLVLGDLIMPEKTGKDVLEAMMKDTRLSNIPMIVMSAKNDKSIISECLAKGAKTFIVKPVRIAEVRSFEIFLKGEDQETQAEKNMGKYKIVKPLGSGSAGSVDLVKNEENGHLYALKTILLSNLNEKERESAECEVHFLRVLTGPTLIKSYKSFVEKDKIMIFMEYAEGGNLAELIEQAGMKEQKFSTETALNWISQVVLGVMLMHSKNILHRDLKGQNLFLTSDGTIKIGDFGISKELPTLSTLAKTAGGTPYFMPPEVCKGEPYGEKADIWAIGGILYEIVFLKKPFDSDTLSGVFEKIVNMPLDEFYEEIDSDLEMLITAMLDKDHSRRPSIWELAATPCINEGIQNFVQEKGGHKEVASLFDSEITKKEKKKSKMYKSIDYDNLDMLSHYIRSDINLATGKNGWFSQIENGGSGYDIIKWICSQVEPDEHKAKQICQKMLDNGFISRIDNKIIFEITNYHIYTFYEDREDLADNMLFSNKISRGWKENLTSALDLSVYLIKLIEEIYRLSIVEVEFTTQIIAEKALKSK